MKTLHVMMNLVAVVTAVLTSLGRPSAALAAPEVTLTPGQSLRVRFTTKPPFTPVVPDVINLSLGLVYMQSPYGTLSASLYDGSKLLGTDTMSDFGAIWGPLSLSPSNGWKSPESQYGFASPAAIDFSSIRDGSIQGRIDFSIAHGAMVIDLDKVRLSMIRANKINGGEPAYPGPQITFVGLVPEPATLFILALGSLLLARRRRA